MNAIIRTLVLIVGLVASFSTFAAAVVERLTGTANVGARVLAVGQRVNAGETITTGAKSQIILRFDDGHALLLNDETELRITDYVFDRNDASKDRFTFDFLKGALRVVTSAFTNRKPDAYALRAPQSTIGIRGTDFMAVVYNPLVVSVISGITTVGNAAGVVSVAAGGLVSVSTAATLATATTLGALPTGVAGSLSSMGSVAVTGGAAAGTGAGSGAGTTGAGSTGTGAGTGAGAGSGAGAGAGAGVASGAAAAGLTAGTLAAGAAAAAAVVGALSPAETTQSTTGTTGTTGTR